MNSLQVRLARGPGRIKTLEEGLENVKGEMQGMVHESAYDLQHNINGRSFLRVSRQLLTP